MGGVPNFSSNPSVRTAQDKQGNVFRRRRTGFEPTGQNRPLPAQAQEEEEASPGRGTSSPGSFFSADRRRERLGTQGKIKGGNRNLGSANTTRRGIAGADPAFTPTAQRKKSLLGN